MDKVMLVLCAASSQRSDAQVREQFRRRTIPAGSVIHGTSCHGGSWTPLCGEDHFSQDEDLAALKAFAQQNRRLVMHNAPESRLGALETKCHRLTALVAVLTVAVLCLLALG